MFSPRSAALIDAIKTRVVVADGAMGTMIQESAPSLEDFENLEGCNEILNVTRPDIISRIHAQYLKNGAEAIETNTFGANFANLAEYGIEERIEELKQEKRELFSAVVGDIPDMTDWTRHFSSLDALIRLSDSPAAAASAETAPERDAEG